MKTKISEEDEKKVKIMNALPFFKTFSDDELFTILNSSRWLKFSPGDFIVKEGETDNSFYIVLKGSVTIQKRTGVGNFRKPLSTLSTGHCFGEMSVITGNPRTADVTTNEQTFLLRLDAETLNSETESLEFKSIQLKFYKIFSEILADRLNALAEKFVRPV